MSDLKNLAPAFLSHKATYSSLINQLQSSAEVLVEEEAQAARFRRGPVKTL